MKKLLLILLCMPMLGLAQMTSEIIGWTTYDLQTNGSVQNRIAIKVKKGHSINLLCEGCNNKAIYKDEDGLIYLVKDENKEMKFYPIKLEEL